MMILSRGCIGTGSFSSPKPIILAHNIIILIKTVIFPLYLFNSLLSNITDGLLRTEHIKNIEII